MAKDRVKYVQLEPDAFLSDVEFQYMSSEQRGAYCTLIFYLYRNNGKLINDGKLLSRLCNVDSNFDFSPVLSKFKLQKGFIYHKRVNKELQKAQTRIDAAVKAANTRWGKQCDRNATVSMPQSQVKVSNGKVSKGKESTKNTYMEFVFLTPDEYKKLIEKFGEQGTKDRIAALNDYIGSKGKKYKSHYHTILTWDRKNGNSEQPKKLQLFPIKGKNCTDRGCNLPAVYKDASGSYDQYYCAEHMPEKVKKLYG